MKFTIFDRTFIGDSYANRFGYETHRALHRFTEFARSNRYVLQFGANFVGFRVLPNRIRMRNDNLQRSRHRLRALQSAYTNGEIALQDLTRSIQSWIAQLNHADSWRLRRSVFEAWSFVPLPKNPLS